MGRGGLAGAAPVEARITQLSTPRDGMALSLRDYATKAEALEPPGCGRSDTLEQVKRRAPKDSANTPSRGG
jgi:hypothetical protein